VRPARKANVARKAQRKEPGMTVVTVSRARANFQRLIDQAAASLQPIFIAGKHNSAVLLSAEDWRAIQETLHLLSIPGMRKSIRDAMAEPLLKREGSALAAHR
jgi:antitoxin YefM